MGDAGYDGWEFRESGPSAADHTVLLLAGALCPAAFYDDLTAEPTLSDLRMVAATLPGFAGTPAPADLSVDANAGYAAALAAEVTADVVVGHSLGANYVLEMAAARQFTGPVVLLSPSFSAEDEFKELKTVAKIGKLPGLGGLAWRLTVKMMPKAAGKSFPEARRDALIAGMQRNDPRFCRAIVPQYFDYLGRDQSLVDRLCRSGSKVWVAFGDHEEVGLADDERRGLEACPSVTLVSALDSTHFVMLDQPARCAEIILEAIRAV
ncbi:MAG: alpha/beta hydrolase [Ilumatobacteraceae bacterium]|nr:alpha/beta hydrolase [Ilumatobacteraceae bacterium]